MSDLPTTQAPDPIMKGKKMSPTYHSPSEKDDASKADSNPTKPIDSSTHQRNFRPLSALAIFLAVVCILIAIGVFFYFRYASGMFLF